MGVGGTVGRRKEERESMMSQHRILEIEEDILIKVVMVFLGS